MRDETGRDEKESLSTEEAIDRAERYLAAMEARELDSARGFLSDRGLTLVFPGGRVFSSIDEIVANSGRRYARVGKHIDRRSAWAEGGAVHVLIAGTLHGAWPDGTAFDGIRFIDLFEFRGGLIVRQEVWNDAGERVLARQAEGA